MNTRTLCALMVGMAAGTANAAELGIRWKDFPDDQLYPLGLAPSDTTVIEIMISLQSGEAVGGVGIAFCSVFNFSSVSSEVKAPGGWVDSSTYDVLGSLGQWASFSIPAGGELSGPYNGPLANVTIHLDSLEGDTIKEIFINHDALVFVDGAGYGFTWDARYNNTATWPGYIAYSWWGNQGWPDLTYKGTPFPGSGQPTPKPLLIGKDIPEPASLSLLALGGLLVIRRRWA